MDARITAAAADIGRHAVANIGLRLSRRAARMTASVNITPMVTSTRPSSRDSVPSQAKASSVAAAMTIAGSSRRRVCIWIASGCSAALRPRIRRMLTVLVPAMFPIASEPLP